MTLILHCGAPKCGSSAVQAALTHIPELRSRSGRRVVYGALVPDRGVIAGAHLARAKGSRDYRASMSASRLAGLDLDQLAAALRAIEADDIVLSCEGWFAQAGLFAETLAALDMPVKVVAYVRPQVAWMNSAWWQWGAWVNQPFKRAIENRLALVQWDTLAAAWEALPQVEEVIVRLLPGDVVPDFYEEVLDVEVPEGLPRDVNKSLPGSMLRLFQRNRDLRPGPHDSEIEFLIGKYVDLPGKTPWVLDRPTVRTILDATRESNLALLERLPPEQAEAMRADPRWWDAEAYADKTREPPGPVDPDADTLEVMCVALIKALTAQAEDHRAQTRAARRGGKARDPL